MPFVLVAHFLTPESQTQTSGAGINSHGARTRTPVFALHLGSDSANEERNCTALVQIRTADSVVTLCQYRFSDLPTACLLKEKKNDVYSG